MNIRKIQSGIKIESSVNIFLDPVKISEEDISIITDPERNANHNKVFNLPGDYELNGVLIKGFDGEKYTFLIQDDLNILYFIDEPTQKTIEELQEKFGDIDCVIAPAISNPNMFMEKLGAKIFITFTQPLKIADFEFVKSHNIKINPKKLIRISYFLE